jgi:Raf kinase inhibitor-like YbhB/YbcL family protein
MADARHRAENCHHEIPPPKTRPPAPWPHASFIRAHPHPLGARLTFPAMALLLSPAPRAKARSTLLTAMKITTKAFSPTHPIPARFTADGADVNPPLALSGVPREAKSLVLIVDDPDAPLGTWNHWLVWNIKPDTTAIAENSVPPGAVVGRNDAGTAKYTGPNPPRGTHRYVFRLFALDTKLQLPATADRATLDEAMQGHVIARAEVPGRYGRE